MPKRRKKRAISKVQNIQSFIVEIGEWELTYILSINYDRDRTGAFREHAGIEFQGKCVFPEQLVGRTAQFNVAGTRAA